MSLTKSYFDFIELLGEVGREAIGELSHCDFTDDDEKTAKESVKHYKHKLWELQNKLAQVEKKVVEKFGSLE